VHSIPRDPAYGAASKVTPKFVSPSNPAAQWTGALRDAAFFVYAEVGASQTMLVRTQKCFGIRPQWLVGDTVYGAARTSIGWSIRIRHGYRSCADALAAGH
jgi:hypothetical protein